jgi:hypothetical protein
LSVVKRPLSVNFDFQESKTFDNEIQIFPPI